MRRVKIDKNSALMSRWNFFVCCADDFLRHLKKSSHLRVFWCHAMCFDKTTTKNNIWRESNIHGNLEGRLISATRLIFLENSVLIALRQNEISLWGEIVVWTTLKACVFRASKSQKICRDYWEKNRRFDWVCVLEEITSFPGALKASHELLF